MLSRFLLAGALALASITASADARAATHTTSSHPDGGPVFVMLRPITLPVIQGAQVARQVTLQLSLELGEGYTELAVDQVRPRLIQAFIDDLSKVYEKTNLATQTIDAGLIKKKLQASADRVLGSGVVSAVLIQQAMERTP